MSLFISQLICQHLMLHESVSLTIHLPASHVAGVCLSTNSFANISVLHESVYLPTHLPASLAA
jgi:hypothetical protein